ncbi:MAG: septum formation initiator family protein [Saprospiraceae bacterium]|nr:septum formation initiator family protein [Saprospiraceae bacterium]
MLPPPLRNPFIVVLIIFGIWMFLFDGANVFTQWRLSQSVENLEEDKAYYQDRIKEVEAEQQSFDENVEEYAREKYYMKKANEDVFIIEE